jgi:hypothetical protein
MTYGETEEGIGRTDSQVFKRNAFVELIINNWKSENQTTL